MRRKQLYNHFAQLKKKIAHVYLQEPCSRVSAIFPRASTNAWFSSEN